MSEREQGRVMPFGMSGARLRRSAQEYRRRGQVLEALSLVRRAAWQDDTASGWQALAAQLRQMSCWEAAGVLLGRVISRDDRRAAAWLDMARCMSALGQRVTAEDCLYHLLYEDPWSQEADAAREMLAAMDDEKPEERPGRAALLSQRAMACWQRGERELGKRRMARAIRLTEKKAPLLTALALMYVAEGKGTEGVRCLTRAVKADPDNPLPVCSMSALLHQMGKRRISRAMLNRAAPMCTDPQMEERFCATAWLMDAWPELEEYLHARLKRTPHRIPLLHARATMLNETGRTGEAQEIWRLILAIDPTDRSAAAMLDWTKENPGIVLPLGRPPEVVLARQRQALEEGAELFRWGGPARCALDWCAASADEKEQQLALDAVQNHADRRAEALWLQEILTRPDVQETMRQKALMRLAQLGRREQHTALVGGRYMTVQYNMPRESPGRSLWRLFLPVLLRTVGRYGHVSEITHFASRLWRLMDLKEKQEAAAEEGVSWSRAMMVMWMWQQGRTEEADAFIMTLNMPMRRFRRVIGRFLLTLENHGGDAGEGDT